MIANSLAINRDGRPAAKTPFGARRTLLQTGDRAPSDLVFAVGQGSHQGGRERNEDRLGWFSNPGGELFVVADGMGGHNGGQEAADTVLAAFRGCFETPEGEGSAGPISGGESPNPEELLLRAVLAADRQVAAKGEEQPSLAGLGSTVVVLLLRGREIWYSHVGDSRLYLFSGGELQQLTTDHSLVQEMIEAGRLSPLEAESHPDRHLLTQSLGGGLDPGQIRIGHRRCVDGDVFLLCSDGLSGPVPARDIGLVLGRAWPVQRQANQLIELALAAGGPDNVTLQLIAIGRSPVALEAGLRSKIRGLIARLAAALFLKIGFR